MKSSVIDFCHRRVSHGDVNRRHWGQQRWRPVSCQLLSCSRGRTVLKRVLHTVFAWMRGDSLVRRKRKCSTTGGSRSHTDMFALRYNAARQETSCVCQWAAGGWYKTTEYLDILEFLRFHLRKKKKKDLGIWTWILCTPECCWALNVSENICEVALKTV